VKLANNTGDATSAQTVGFVLSASIASNQKGFIVVSGLLDGLSILPTSTWADGDPVYLGATAGTITNVKPSAPNHLVYLGFVTTASNGSAGRLYVRVQNGYEMDEIHDVAISSPTNGQTLTYDSATSLWKNTTPTGGTLINKGSFGAVADSSTTGIIGYITIPYSGTITGWQVIGDVSGSCVFDVWKTASGIIPTVANTITGTEKPTLSSQQINSDLSLSTWTTAVTAGDIVAINLDSASTLSEAWLTVFITKTS